MNLNIVIIAGKLSKPSETKTLPSGVKLCSLNVLLERAYKSKDGQETKEKCFVDVQVWGKEVEHCEGLMEGEQVVIKGRLKAEKWMDKATGAERFRLSVNAETVEVIDPNPSKQQSTVNSLGGVGAFNWNQTHDKKLDELPF